MPCAARWPTAGASRQRHPAAALARGRAAKLARSPTAAPPRACRPASTRPGKRAFPPSGPLPLTSTCSEAPRRCAPSARGTTGIILKIGLIARVFQSKAREEKKTASKQRKQEQIPPRAAPRFTSQSAGLGRPSRPARPGELLESAKFAKVQQPLAPMKWAACHLAASGHAGSGRPAHFRDGPTNNADPLLGQRPTAGDDQSAARNKTFPGGETVRRPPASRAARTVAFCCAACAFDAAPGLQFARRGHGHHLDNASWSLCAVRFLSLLPAMANSDRPRQSDRARR